MPLMRKTLVESLIYQYIHQDIIPEDIFEVIKPIYVRLTKKSFLQNESTGAFQNASEPFHGIVWQHCPKGAVCWKRAAVDSLPALLSFSLSMGHTVAHLCAWRKWLSALSERRSCRGRILFVTVYKIKRKGTGPHQKGQEKWDWGALGKAMRKSWRILKVQPMKHGYRWCSSLDRWYNRHQHV